MVKIGDRIKFVGQMDDNPAPLMPGEKGTVDWLGASQLGVKWDSGRALLLILGHDRFEVIG
jgi:Domain of unknown function (DUF4314)